MANVVGEEFAPYVSNQINARQIVHGSGQTRERSEDE